MKALIKSETSTFTLSRAAKAKWLKALRSGKFKQADGALYDGTGYCCLGVLCVTQGADTKSLSDVPFPTMFGDEGQEADFWRVRAATKGLVSLSYLNDMAEKSFSEIADIIEAAVPCHD